MLNRMLIYGATGYTGKLIARSAAEKGMLPVLCGRSERKLGALAEELELDWRVARLDEAAALDRALRDVDVVVHAAGPFSATSRAMVDACLRTRTHYLDVSGEVLVVEALRARNAEALDRGVMIMPAVGFDVVPSDCLAVHVVRRLPGARRLQFGVRGLRWLTRGSAKTVVEQADRLVKIRRDGQIVAPPPGSLQRSFDYGDGPRLSLAVAWGDVATAYYSTGVPNVEVYFEENPGLAMTLSASRLFGWLLQTAPWQAWLKASCDSLPEGPTDPQRAAIPCVIVVEAQDPSGARACSRLRTPDCYGFTAETATAVARRALEGDLEIGFQTPGRVYGADFVLSLPGVWRQDVEA